MAASSPRAALVHDWLTGMRGGEKVLEAIGSLYPDSPIYTLLHFPGSVSATLESHPIETSFLQRAPGVRKHYRKYLPFFPAAIEDLDLTWADLIISTSHCVAKGVIPRPGALHLCYCHTPMRYAWDQEYAYFPDRRGLKARLRGLLLSRLRIWDVSSAHRVDRFVANSRFVAERIRRFYGRDADVVAPPVDTEYFTPGPGQEGDYCLYVSALAPYKRIDLAIEATRNLGLELRVVGDGPERARLERLGDGSTRILGRVGADELRALYRGARCFVQPGIEDFGISAVEALACGCPVIALGDGGVTDIVRDGREGLLYQGEGSGEALAAAITAAEKIDFDQAALRARAEKFSSDRFLDEMKRILDRISIAGSPAAIHRRAG